MPHVAYESEGPSATEGMSSTERTLILGVLAALATVAAVLVLSIRHLDEESSVRAFFTGLSQPTALVGSAPQPAFALGPIDMGMTAAALRERRVDVRFMRSNGDALIAFIQDDRAAYTAWFSSGNTDATVIRVRYDRTFAERGLESILDSMGQRFGKPVSSWCDGGAINGTQECTFRWMPRDSIVVDARYRLDADAAGRAQTVFTLVATDHAAKAPAAAPGEETLPF